MEENKKLECPVCHELTELTYEGYIDYTKIQCNHCGLYYDITLKEWHW